MELIFERLAWPYCKNRIRFDNFRHFIAYKKYRNRWENSPKKHSVGTFPIHIDFEMTTYCTLDCHTKVCIFKCPHEIVEKEKLPKRHFCFETFQRIIDEGMKKGLCSIKLNYRGEPLLHPRLVEFIRYAKKKQVLDVMLNTNATLLTNETIENLIDSGIDKISCCLVYPNKDVFESCRGADTFTTVVQNIKQLVVARSKHKAKKPIVVLQVFELNDNISELDEQLNEWRDCVDEISISKPYDFILAEPWNTNRTTFACPYLWQRLFILYNGDVMMCCGDHSHGDALGNVSDNSIESLWRGVELERIRKMHTDGRSGEIPICAKCGFRKQQMELKG